MALNTLSDNGIAILELEARFWSTAGGKEQAVRDELSMAPVRYYQTLNQLIDTESALACHPVLVNRLRRMRAVR